ncbi:MAG TPA: FKBP-type peptidyl-prolyl cis-trans isomerase [Mucilaginibacter sp.]|jgi:FKBP-type peptidyl-prolyl cis-trans isomerase FkpA|nr:FKBP-type peptidyl-prolyl cis-trans isomerase [Mucilaginibacter sp.]
MNKWLLPILLFCVAMAGCGKTQSGLAQYRAQAATDDKIVANYIAEHNLTEVAKKVSDTAGVYYIVLQQGQGNDLFTTSTQVTVGDTGKLLSTGTIFTKTNNFHPSYVLGQVILGWQLGIPKINTGGIVRLLIPSRYAYGPNAQPSLGLPANAILDFDIQLYNVTN